MLIPKFKLDWVQEEDEQQKIIEHLKLCLQSFWDDSSESKSEDLNIDIDKSYDTFFKFKRKKTSSVQLNNISSIIENYLYTNKYDNIKDFPAVLKRAFIKHNTSVPSSAHVERLFSAGGLLYDDLRGKLSDRHFEMTLLLKFNNYL